ncbi:MAG TPA: PRC and DUF2382 domain-containing protein [Baekduia sp.]|nr:PRC and DUF2382 domain-containing protein [Baekduia sp.]
MSITLQEARTYRGATLVDSAGEKIGTIDEIYLDRASGQPEWAAVKTGLFGMRSSFVPISSASPSGAGELRVDVTKDQVKDAPQIDADGELSPQEEQRLYTHYGRGDYEWSGEDRTRDLGLGEERFSRGAGHDTSGPNTDDAMTRSEEELRVGKASRESGRARLRKYVVTEEQQVTVPVQREEVRVEREAITDANVDQALDGPAISEEEHEVVLHEEEPIVEKRAVPKERVRLKKDAVTDERTVSDEVRKERIEAEGDLG